MAVVTPGPGFVLTQVSVTSTSVFASSDTISIPDKWLGRPIMVYGTVGSADALGHMTITHAATHTGTHKDFQVDTDLNTATELVPFSTNNAYTTAASGTFMVYIAKAPPELIFKFKKATNNTTVDLTGTVLVAG